jgi:AcrR family transcriptional regulator
MKSSERKTEILTTAARLFKEKGYGAVSMRDLAAAVNIKAASLYNHIQSKHEILKEIIMPLAHEYTSGMDVIYKSHQSSVHKLELVIEQHVDVSLQYPDSIASLNNEWMNLEGETLNLFIAMRNDYETRFRDILTTGIHNGELKPMNIELAVFTILGTLRTLHLWQRKKKNYKADALKSELKNLLLNGVVTTLNKI